MSFKAKLISGKTVSGAVIDEVSALTAKLKEETGITPGLAVVLVGEDPASQVYVRNKGERAEQCGFNSVQHNMPADSTQQDVIAQVEALNADPAVHGILVQLPLPKHLDDGPVINAISPEKDVDGLHVVNAGKLAAGELETAHISCTPAGSMRMLRDVHGKDLSGLHAIVIGRSKLVGKPMAALLLEANATVTVAHSRTKDLPAMCKQADIVVAAVGRPQMVKADWIKEGATVIDVGINRIPAPERGEGKNRLVGDVDFDDAANVAGAITPVPGGVGLMTVAMLMANTMKAAYRAAGKDAPSL